MASILVGLGIFTPFATSEDDCKGRNNNSITTKFPSDVSKIFSDKNQTAIDKTFWDENQILFPSIVTCAFFIVITVLLLVFVKENKGKS